MVYFCFVFTGGIGSWFLASFFFVFTGGLVLVSFCSRRGQPAAEGSKAEGREAMSEQELKAAEEATLKEKEAAITTRAEEKRSAVRREALGWDRCAQAHADVCLATTRNPFHPPPLTPHPLT